MAQPPQFITSLATLTSQPVSGFWSQSAQSGEQLAMLHTPSWQAWTLFAPMHFLPQAPQFFASACVAISQPSIDRLLQSAKPMLQEAMAQLPERHAGVALAGAQAFMQFPQWATSCFRSASQPSWA